MSLVEMRRRSNRVKSKKMVYTPVKTINNQCKGNSKTSKIYVDYELNKNKAISNKLEASERTLTVVPEYKSGNLVLTFSAAAYEEFRIVTKNVLLSSDLHINQTNTTDKSGAIVSESLNVTKSRKKIFVLNFYNSTSRVLLNGNQNHIIDFVSSQLSDILLILDRNKDFMNLNAKIREYCKCFLNKSKCQDSNIEPTKDCDPEPSACYSDLPITYDINCSDNENDENSICPTCLLLCETDSKAVECDSCSFWVHYECENITSEEIKHLEENSKIEYICKGCVKLRNDHAINNQTPKTVTKTYSALNNSASNQIVSKQTLHNDTSTCMNIADNSNKNSDERTMHSPNTHVKRNIQLKVNKLPTQSTDKSPVKVQTQKQSSPSKFNIQNSSSIQDEEISHLKTKLARSEKLLKTKDSQFCKLDSEMNTLKKELATNRAYTVKLEQDIIDLETSLRIQKQKNGVYIGKESHNGDEYARDQNEDLKSWVLEQRIKTLEFDAIKQDNKISNLSDKLMDLKIDLMSHGNQSRRPHRQKRSNRHNNEINEPGNDNINSCTNNIDHLMEEEFCLRTDEIPDSQSGASLDFLDKQGQKKHARMKENQLPKNRKRPMNPKVHTPIKKPLVIQQTYQNQPIYQPPQSLASHQSHYPNQHALLNIPPRIPPVITPFQQVPQHLYPFQPNQHLPPMMRMYSQINQTRRY